MAHHDIDLNIPWCERQQNVSPSYKSRNNCNNFKPEFALCLFEQTTLANDLPVYFLGWQQEMFYKIEPFLSSVATHPGFRGLDVPTFIFTFVHIYNLKYPALFATEL